MSPLVSTSTRFGRVGPSPRSLTRDDERSTSRKVEGVPDGCTGGLRMTGEGPPRRTVSSGLVVYGTFPHRDTQTHTLTRVCTYTFTRTHAYVNTRTCPDTHEYSHTETLTHSHTHTFTHSIRFVKVSEQKTLQESRWVHFPRLFIQ